jgi:signal transduction histidine kinase/ligand-binding sensor domain-containing protein
MTKTKAYFLTAWQGLFILALFSCHTATGDHAFFAGDTANLQPPQAALHLGPARQLHWVTVKKGPIEGVTRTIDFKTLPSVRTDTMESAAPLSAPSLTTFDPAKLADTTIAFDALPETPLKGRTVLARPASVFKAGKLNPKEGTPYSVADFGPKQGLRGSVISTITKDRYGSVWIATELGLYRYDGDNLRRYADDQSRLINGMVADKEGRIWFLGIDALRMLDPARGTISTFTAINGPVNDLAHLFLDSKGNIWIAHTKNGGLVVVDPRRLTFRHLAGWFPACIYMMEDADHRIWATGPGSGVRIIDPATGKIKSLKKADGLASDSLYSLTLDKDGVVWMTTGAGMVDAVDLRHGSIRRYNVGTGPKNFLIATNSSFDSKGRLWMTNGSRGLAVLDPVRGVIETLDPRIGLPQGFVISMLKDDDRIWIGTNFGMCIIGENTGQIRYFEKSAISTQCEDKMGNIWVGLSAEGVRILDSSRRSIRQLAVSNNFIQYMQSLDGDIYIGSDGGLDIFDPSRHTVTHIGHKEGLPNDTIFSITKDNHGDVWMSGPSGIIRMDSGRLGIGHAGLPEGLSGENVTDMNRDTEGRIWLATLNKGVDIIDPRNGTIRNWNSVPGIHESRFKVLMPDRYGRMWVGTGQGIYVVDIGRNTVTNITKREGLTDNRVYNLLHYEDRAIASTAQQLTVIDIPPPGGVPDAPAREKWMIRPLKGSEGFAKQANTWSSDLVTARGEYFFGDIPLTVIPSLAPDTSSAQTVVTGLQLMNATQSFVDPDRFDAGDTLWGEDTFYLKGHTSGIAGFANDAHLRWDSVSGPYNMPVNLRIPFDQNYIQFDFGETGRGRQDTIWYRYVLQGIDKQWRPQTANPFSDHYLNLPPGDYTFKVSSRGPDGLWGPPGTLSFTITPPWWKSWWAYTLYGLLLAAAVAKFIQYRSRKLVAENLALEQKIKQRTVDLEQSLEELKTTQQQLIQSEKMASLGELTAGIAHEIQNPLNFVNNFAEVNIELVNELKEELSRLDGLDENTRSNIEGIMRDLVQNQEKINFHGKRADSIVKGMLQHSRTGTGQKEPADINVLADEYLRLSYHGLRAKDKTFNAKLDTAFEPGLPRVSILLQELGRVLLNLYNNSFYSVMKKMKEGRAGYQPTVSVSTRLIGREIEIKVRDNGIGIPQTVLDKIYNPFFTTKPSGEGTGLGLSLSYEIITKGHGGSIRVDTKEGEYAEFTIRLPL